ncbi:MAG: sialate O-acetylesterase [Rhodothermales bacterium]
MKYLLVSIYCLFALAGCQRATPAEVIELPVLFSNNMVMQRDANIKVWGKATPHERVKVRFKNQSAEIDALADSSWMVHLAPEPAGGPYELYVAGEETITISNVLVGEVWLASGQSNMEWPLQASNNAEAEIAAATDDQIRLFTVKKTMAGEPATTIPSDGWEVNSPETIPGFSAVAYFFARALRDSLEVPVGLINSSWGGTRSEAWTSSEALLEHPDYIEQVQALIMDPAGFEASSSMSHWLRTIEENDRGLSDGEPVWAARDLDDSSWSTMVLPDLWENDALPNYDGVVWFRKEFELPASWVGQDITLSLAKVDDIDQTWVNGIKVGETDQYNLLREYQIPASALSEGTNVVTVRAVDTGGGGGIWGDAADMYVRPANNATPLSIAGSWKYNVAVDLKNPDIPRIPSGQHHTPTVLYNAMIHPLIPYAIQGAIWYQGESNAGRAHQYQSIFPALISDWRMQWNSDLSFHFVQLANFMKQQENPSEEETWPELREAQTMALQLTNTGMAVTIDIGEADDIHPRNKQDVGRRLALSALNVTYAKGNTAAGPLYKSFAAEGNEIRIQFDHAEHGLMTPDGAKLTGFAIAGDDQVFHWADARIDSSEVVVSSRRVAAPVAVRYGWANNPIVNLYNTERLPASPFRTDDWPGITVGVK